MFIKVNAKLSGGGDQKGNQQQAKSPQAANNKQSPESFKGMGQDSLQQLSNEKIKEHFDQLKFHYMKAENVEDSKEWILSVFTALEKPEVELTFEDHLKEIEKLPELEKLGFIENLISATDEEENKQVAVAKRNEIISANLPDFSIANDEKKLSNYVEAFIKLTATEETETKIKNLHEALLKLSQTIEPDNKQKAVEEVISEINSYKNDTLVLPWIRVLKDNFGDEVKHTIKMEIIIGKMSQYPNIKEPVDKVIFIDNLRSEIKVYADEIGENAQLKHIFGHLDKTRRTVMEKFTKPQLQLYNTKKKK